MTSKSAGSSDPRVMAFCDLPGLMGKDCDWELDWVKVNPPCDPVRVNIYMSSPTLVPGKELSTMNGIRASYPVRKV